MSDISTSPSVNITPSSDLDPNAKIPEAVKRAAAAAEAFYKPQETLPEQPSETPPTEEVVAPVETPSTTEVPSEPPKPRRGRPPKPKEPVPEVIRQDDEGPQHTAPSEVKPSENFEHMYLSMKGRYDQAQRTIGSMQEQMSELGNELLRTQQFIQRRGPPTPVEPPKLLTDKDVQTYGEDLLDTVKRGALEAVAPKITALEQENAKLRQEVSRRISTQEHRTIFDALDAEIPDWREINVSPEFKQWLRLRDVYSNQVRDNLLKSAFQAANAPQVVAFFKGYLAEVQATGQRTAPPVEPAASPAPRQAAVPLETLTAPGKARPATGDTQVSPADKPIITRAEIAKFYQDVRRGIYSGRDADKARDEQRIFAAQREGRVR